MNEIYEFIKKCGTYYLATVEDNQPRNRPFGTVNLFDGKLYIQTGKSKMFLSRFKKIHWLNFAVLMVRQVNGSDLQVNLSAMTDAKLK